MAVAVANPYLPPSDKSMIGSRKNACASQNIKFIENTSLVAAVTDTKLNHRYVWSQKEHLLLNFIWRRQMTKVTANASLAAALIVSGLTLGTHAIAEDTSVEGPKEGTIHCTVTRSGFNWNTCPSKQIYRKKPVPIMPGQAPGGKQGPVAPGGENPISFEVFGFNIESSPTQFTPQSSGANVDGGGGDGGGRG